MSDRSESPAAQRHDHAWDSLGWCVCGERQGRYMLKEARASILNSADPDLSLTKHETIIEKTVAALLGLLRHLPLARRGVGVS